jgi:hypothetical protein
MKTLAIVFVAMLACVGCDKKEDAAPTAGAKPEKAVEAVKEAPKVETVPAVLAQADPDDDIATAADFEDEAEKEIDNASVEAEVDKLAKEIGE